MHWTLFWQIIMLIAAVTIAACLIIEEAKSK